MISPCDGRASHRKIKRLLFTSVLLTARHVSSSTEPLSLRPCHERDDPACPFTGRLCHGVGTGRSTDCHSGHSEYFRD